MFAGCKKTVKGLDLTDEDKPSQFESAILHQESQRLQTENSQKSTEDPSQESSQKSHCAHARSFIDRSFIDRYHRKMENLIRTMTPFFTPNQAKLDL